MSVRDADSFDRIVEQGRERLDNCENQEHAAALLEIAKIAGHRFDDFVADANPIHSCTQPAPATAEDANPRAPRPCTRQRRREHTVTVRWPSTPPRWTGSATVA